MCGCVAFALCCLKLGLICFGSDCGVLVFFIMILHCFNWVFVVRGCFADLGSIILMLWFSALWGSCTTMGLASNVFGVVFLFGF